ncbi:WSC-domain-containing protein [Sphaerulina musiva SO2202]|uniref:WSC-domain-containing protein n=1 Tax=Sphaerulina musiva (strain SO2202) TaxID=692275 RepID=M3AWR6_SPHMS|nr:WSC-domain-containing protein [Sphaerulina musiva SO2202]EMF11170.1 WSC-domain-containing protein [Sphaerulina musiva SO2202]
MRLSLLLPFFGVVAAQTVSHQGCYGSAGSLTSQGTYIYQSTGYCAVKCKNNGKAVMATTNGTECYCGDALPAASDKVEDSKCNTPCVGYPMDTCGGAGFFSVATLSDGTTGDGTTGNATSVATTASASAVPPVIANPGVSTAAMTSSGASIASTASTTSSASSASKASASSTSTTASYTGAAAHAVVGNGALAMGALLAFL